MPIDICKLCKYQKEIKRSHAIPDAVFRRILKSSDGRAVTFRCDDDSPIRHSGESWWEYQLCQECEGLLNSKYESYAISFFRGHAGNVIKHERGITFNNVNSEKIRMFLISILWRAAESNVGAYSRVKMPGYFKEYIRESLLKQSHIPIIKASVEISRLIDRSNGFTMNSLKSIVISPFIRRNESKQYSFCFFFEGFFIEIFIPGHTMKYRKINMLSTTKRVVCAPYIDIFDIPEVVSSMVEGMRKYQEGNHESGI